jgi:hypothetical protein
VAVPGEVAGFATIEARSFELRAARFFLGLCDGHVCICIISLILALVIGCSGAGQVHGNLHIVVCRLWGISGIVGRSLLLLLLLLPLWLVLLRASSLSLQLELASVLPEGVVKGPQIWESSSSSDKLYHLSAFHNFDSFGLIFVVSCGEQGLYDFV